MFGYLDILLSGLVGALIATALSVIYQYASEQSKYRGNLAIEVVNWLDKIYIRLQEMMIHKERVYSGKDPSLTQEEYRKLSNEVRTLLLSDKIMTIVALTYGEGDKLQKINALQGELSKVAGILWALNQNNWKESHLEIMNSFNKKIDPIKAMTMKEFLYSAKIKSVIGDALKYFFPTFYKLFIRK